MGKIKGIFAITIAGVVLSVFASGLVVQAKKAPKINKTKVTIYKEKTVKLNLSNLTKKQKKKLKWTSSNKSVAAVSKSGLVTAKKVGKATITAKTGKVKKKCTVNVTDFKTLTIDNFESYEVGTDWANYTLGEGLTSGGDDEPHYLAKGETMQVVTDPENSKNKVLKVTPKFYSFAPVFTVDLNSIAAATGKKLGDYAGIRAKFRVVSDAGCHVGVRLNSYFSQAGTIDKRYAFSTYTVPTLAGEKEFYKYYYADGMVDGFIKKIESMPQHESKKVKGYKESEKDSKAGFCTKTLIFNKKLTTTLRALSSFDFVLGGSYRGPGADEYLAWYLDDVQLIYK